MNAQFHAQIAHNQQTIEQMIKTNTEKLDTKTENGKNENEQTTKKEVTE